MTLKGLEMCWLSPQGRVITKDREFFADKSWHEDLALCILRDIWRLEDKMDAFEKVHKKFSHTSTEELEDMKWIRLHCSVNPKWVVPINVRITKKQESIILDWCLENNVSFNDCFSR